MWNRSLLRKQSHAKHNPLPRRMNGSRKRLLVASILLIAVCISIGNLSLPSMTVVRRLRFLEGNAVEAAGVIYDIPELDQMLPTAAEVESMYGAKHVIVGLDQCNAFRKQTKAGERYIAPAGMFTTGTDMMAELLKLNCYIPERVEFPEEDTPEDLGMLDEAPWGKRSPHSHRFTLSEDESLENEEIYIIDENVLPVVMVKDPINWMSSMCDYEGDDVIWNKAPDRCPNLIPNEFDKGFYPTGTVTIDVHYPTSNTTTHYKSLLDLWNEYYGEWNEAEQYPRLIVRFEDLLFHADEVVSDVCSCAGGKMREQFKHISQRTPGSELDHTDENLVASIVRHGRSDVRSQVLERGDERKYVSKELREDLMKAFSYVAPMKTLSAQIKELFFYNMP